MIFVQQLCDELLALGYTHCFFLAGGNVMHLVEACRTRFRMVPVIHEVAAVIGVEYFNEASESGERAFAVVTAGPGLTNAITGIAGAWLESRDVLVLGGQVKSADLARGGVRQLGIQEIDGVSIAAPVTKAAVRIERPIPMSEFRAVVQSGSAGRPGPVFVEICLDAQAAPAVADPWQASHSESTSDLGELPAPWFAALRAAQTAKRPIILLGGGVSRAAARAALPRLENLGIPVAVTWNAADRVPSDSAVYAGRPNTWGMRWANLAIQQSDLIVAIGARLGLQQTGFAWQEFAPLALVCQVDIDAAELSKGRPRVDWPVQAHADTALDSMLSGLVPSAAWTDWRTFVAGLRQRLPVVETANLGPGPELVPQVFVAELSALMGATDVLIPCSSGGAFTVAMQVFANRCGQTIISDKGLASMGYGLAGAVGAALANPDRRVVLTEGDGGFAQNMQELGTVAVNNLNLKIFIMANRGYASIRMTQRNYFNGAYVGCDVESGLGIPDWAKLAAVWDLPHCELHRGWAADPAIQELFDSPGPAVFTVPVAVDQPYWPKIGSRVLPNGSMASAPLHMMSPELPGDLQTTCMPHLTGGVTR